MTTIAPGGQVTFRFFRREAQSVCIAGDFNNWAGQKLEMKSDGDGWWTAQTLLPAGDHRFRYWVDGQWFTDYASHGIEYSPLGINSLIVVPNVGAIERKG